MKKKKEFHCKHCSIIAGKKSAKIRKALGHNSEYYRQLAFKRWGKEQP